MELPIFLTSTEKDLKSGDNFCLFRLILKFA